MINKGKKKKILLKKNIKNKKNLATFNDSYIISHIIILYGIIYEMYSIICISSIFLKPYRNNKKYNNNKTSKNIRF